MIRLHYELEIVDAFATIPTQMKNKNLTNDLIFVRKFRNKYSHSKRSSSLLSARIEIIDQQK